MQVAVLQLYSLQDITELCPVATFVADMLS